MDNETMAPIAPTPASNPIPTANSMLVGVGELFRSTWSVYKENFSLLAGIMAVPALLIVLAALLGGALSVLVQLIAMVATIWGEIALALALLNRQSTTTIADAYRQACHRFWSAFWLMILGAFITTGGIFLFIIPGFIFKVWFSLSLLVLLAEGERGMNALVKSREYIRNYFWAVFGRYILLTIVIGIIYVVIAGIISAILRDQFTAAGINSAIMIALLLPAAMAFLVLLFENLKLVKGGQVVSPANKAKATYLTVAIIGWVILIILMVIVGVAIFNYINGATVSVDLEGVTVPSSAKVAEQLQNLQDQLQALMPTSTDITASSTPTS